MSDGRPMTTDAELFDRLAQLAVAAGRPDAAGELLRQLAARGPADPPADADRLHAEAVTLLQAGRPTEAVLLLMRAVRARPDAAAWHDHLGVALANSGRLPEAEATFRLAAALDRGNPSPARNLMQTCLDQRKWPAALAALDAADAVEPNAADLKLTRAVVLSELGRYAEAEALLTALLERGPASAALWNRLGVVRGLSGRAGEAVECFRQQLALTPRDAGAHANLAAALGKAGRWADAVAAARQAVALDPTAPGGWANLGNALRDLGELSEAAGALRRATDLDPAAAESPGNLGLTLAMAGRLDEAIPWYDEAIRRKPDGAEAHFNRAVARLALGDYARGWPEYEWRWRTEQMRTQPGHATPPRRLPTPAELAGKTVLVHTEQGHGDTIQFLKLAPMVAGLGATVVVLTVSALANLVATAPGVSRVVTPADPPPPHDFALPLMSLPLLLNLRVETIPAAPAYLTADPAAVERWRHAWRDRPRPLVGVAWQGNPRHVGDRWRSVQLAQLAPVAAAVRDVGGTLVAVQVGPGSEQLADAPFPVTDFRAHLPPAAAFADTAAALCALDRVVTVDSAVAHLAGALGRPVAVLLPLNADWRWLRDRPDTPWYPSATLMRCREFADWHPAIEAAARWVRSC